MKHEQSLMDLTKRESGVLLFHYNGGDQMIICNWSSCPEGTLPLVFCGQSIISMPNDWECVDSREVESVVDMIDAERTELRFDQNNDYDDLVYDDPKGVAYDLKCRDGESITVLVPEGWN